MIAGGSPAASIGTRPALPPREREDHHNQFGVVRLVLALLVIVSHAFPLARGYGSPDPLYALTQTTTFGDIAVDFFFVISGYLVTQSLDRSRSTIAYLGKRARRIYPGFAVAVPISLGLGLACAGTWRWPHDAMRLAMSLLTLQQPIMTSAFGGNVYPIANGALWTIRYETLCYLLPLAMALAGRRRGALSLVAASALLLLSGLYQRDGHGWLAAVHNPLRLSGCFLAGIALLARFEQSPPRAAATTAAAALCAAALFWPPAAGIGIGIAGGYAVLALCLHPGRSRLSRIGRRNDVSYGTYLYGWPLENLVIWLMPAASPWLVLALATPMAIAAGWISWRLVEAPFLRRRLRATVT